MSAKKKIIVKEKPKQVEKEKPVYKPVFLPIVEKKTIKIDANYYGIKQYLKNHIGIDLFKKLRNGDKKEKPIPKFKKYPSTFADYYQETNIIIVTSWLRYCRWWNNTRWGNK